VQALIELGPAVAIAGGCASVAFPCLALPGRRRARLLLALSVLIAASPALVQSDAKLARFAAALVAVVMLVKLYDLHVSAERNDRLSFGAHIVWLLNWFSIVHRKVDAEPRPPRAEDGRRLLVAASGCLGGSLLLVWAFRVEWFGVPFLVEHSTKTLALFLALVPGASALCAAARLLGGRAREYMDNPFIARTPAEFWRRYNRVAQQFFYEDIFQRLGGLRRPVQSTLTTFAVSALVHEYLMSIAAGRIQGYQTAFFLIHGAAVAATWRIRPTGPIALAWIAATLAFNLVSSVLFFASVNELFPFYSKSQFQNGDWLRL
jgi:hypothetical protein